jgi:hypothetical protein
LKARARIQVQAARKLLEFALPLLGSSSPEGKEVAKSIVTLSKLGMPMAEGLSMSEHQAMAPSGAPEPPQPAAMAARGPQGGGVAMSGPQPSMLTMG